MARQYRIGVIGFGMAGALVSALLAREGHAVSLFERAPVVGPVGAGILLQPSGQMILRSLGLLDRVVQRAEPIQELHAVQLSGRTLIRMPYAELEPGCHAYGLHRGDLFTVLHDEVRANGVTVHLNREIRSYQADKRGVFLSDQRGERHGPFDFLLGTDGSRSALRTSSHLHRRIEPYPHGTLWVNGQATAVRHKLFQVVRGSRQLLGVVPMGEGRCSFYWGLPRYQQEPLRRRGLNAWKAEVLAFCPLAAELVEPLTSFAEVTFTTYQHVWMNRWHDEHLLFLGDAAHAMSPHLGQGVNLALIDAYRFTRALAQATDHRQAFRAYTRARRHHLNYYACVTYLLSPFFQSDGFIKGLGRDMALPIMHRTPWVRGQMLLTMAGLKSGFFGGRMRL